MFRYLARVLSTSPCLLLFRLLSSQMEVSEAEEGIDSDFDDEESDRKRQAAVVSLLEQYEKDRSKVKFGKRIGDGASGTVYEVFQNRT